MKRKSEKHKAKIQRKRDAERSAYESRTVPYVETGHMRSIWPEGKLAKPGRMG